MTLMSLRTLYQVFRSVTLAYDTRDCGPAALVSVCRFYKAEVSLTRCRLLVETDIQGTRLYRLVEGAQALGFKAAAGKIALSNLAQLPKPYILHQDNVPSGHFIVIFMKLWRWLLVNDPSRGLCLIREDHLATTTSGHVLILENTKHVRATCEKPQPLRAFIKELAATPDLLLLSLFAACSGVAISATASVMLRVMLSPTRQLRSVAHYEVLVFAVAILVSAGATRLYRDHRVAALGQKFEDRLAQVFMAQLLNSPLNVIERVNSIEMANHIQGIGVIRNGLMNTLAGALFDASLLLITVLLVALVSPILMLLVALSSSIILAGALLQGLMLLRLDRETRLANGLFFTAFSDSVQFLRTFRAYNAEHTTMHRISAAHKAWLSMQKKRTQVLDGSRNIISIGVTVTGILLMSKSFSYVATQGFPLGRAIMFYTLLGSCLSVMASMGGNVAQLMQSVDAYHRLGGVLDSPLAKRNEGSIAKQHKPSSSVPLIVIQELEFAFPNYPRLFFINKFTIFPGDWVQISGRSGCGKSTLACLLAGLHGTVTGSLKLDGVPIASYTESQIRDVVNVVFQEPAILRGSIRDNILVGDSNADDGAIWKALETVQLKEFVLELPRKLQHSLADAGNSLSSGQKQRISLARAILRNTPILILDEATSHLDIATEESVLNRLREERRGRTTLVITHRHLPAQEGDRCFCFLDGDLLEQSEAINGIPQKASGLVLDTHVMA